MELKLLLFEECLPPISRFWWNSDKIIGTLTCNKNTYADVCDNQVLRCKLFLDGESLVSRHWSWLDKGYTFFKNKDFCMSDMHQFIINSLFTHCLLTGSFYWKIYFIEIIKMPSRLLLKKFLVCPDNSSRSLQLRFFSRIICTHIRDVFTT